MKNPFIGWADKLKARKLVRKMNAVKPNRLNQKLLTAEEAEWLVGYLCPHEDEDRKKKLVREMVYGNIMLRKDGAWACNTCGGNCGQCGNTSFYGNIGFSMEHLIEAVDP